MNVRRENKPFSMLARAQKRAYNVMYCRKMRKEKEIREKELIICLR